MVDLRSDTVTKPSAAMRKAMAEAEVGDDVFGEDPTVNRLQETVAELLGKEDALFVPSGVMANQIAIKLHTEPGDEIIVERDAHIFRYETAAPALLARVQINTLIGEEGVITAQQIESELQPPAYYLPRTSLVCLENTHNRAGGTIYPLEEIRHIRALCASRGIRLHLDGARLWNAWVATGIHPKEYASEFDTVAVCFSKGLGAPVGSALAGTKSAIERARKYRKVFGGGMRQAGIIAAGALYALQHNVERLQEDHANARRLAEALASLPGFDVDSERVKTNIVIINIRRTGKTAQEVLNLLRSEGVLLTEMGGTIVRAVTHLDITREDIKRSIAAFHRVFRM